MLRDGAVSKLSNLDFEITFSLFYILVKTRNKDFRNITHAEIQQVLTFR